MANHLKLLSLAAALCGAVACSSSDNGTTSGTGGGPGTTGTSSGTAAGGSPTGTASGGSPTASATGGSPTASGGGNTSTGTGTGGSTTGGSTTGAPPPSTYPCVDGGAAYQPTNPPSSLASCWCNPGVGGGALAYYQIINGCPPPNSTPDLSIPLPPPVGTESITGLSGANLPLFIDAGIPGE